MSFDLRLEGGDLKIDNNSRLSTVENGEKLVQDMLKIITTQLGANRMFPWYGCPITQSLVGTAFDYQMSQGIATNQLRSSIENLQRLQREQLKEPQEVTPHEHIASILDILVDQNRIDPRFFNITVSVISKAFRRADANLSVNLA